MEKEMNYSKQSMYSDTIQKLNKAIKDEFFYESIMLEYALIEDRLNTMLEHLGIINGGEKGLVITKCTKKSLHMLLNISATARFGINKIGDFIFNTKKIRQKHAH